MPPDARANNGRWASESGNGAWTDAARPSPRNSSVSGYSVGSTGRKPVSSCEEVSQRRKAQMQVKDLDQAELLGRLAAWEGGAGGGAEPRLSEAGTAAPMTPTSRKQPLPSLLLNQLPQLHTGQPSPPPLSPMSPLLQRRSCHSWNGGANPNLNPNPLEAFSPRGLSPLSPTDAPRASPTAPLDPAPHRGGITLISPKPSVDGPGAPPGGLVKAQCDRASAQTSYLLQLLDTTSSPKHAKDAAAAGPRPSPPMRVPRNTSLTRPALFSPSSQSRAASKPDVSADIANFLRFHAGEKKGFSGQLAADAKQALARRNTLTVEAETEDPPDWLTASASATPTSATPTHRGPDATMPYSPGSTPSHDGSTRTTRDSFRTRDSVLAPSSPAQASDSPRGASILSPGAGGPPDLLPRLLSRARLSIHEAAEQTSEATRSLQAALFPPEAKGEHPGVDPACKWRFNPNAGEVGASSSYMYVYKRSNSRSVGGGA